jgi:Kef-type K+ transport system membrane component KefB/nucleotide-binding universal stress UspA family protein
MESSAIFLAQIVVLLLAGRLLGELMQRIGQPPVMGQLLGGVLLGPSVLGAFLPEFQHHLFPPAGAQRGMLEGVAQLGVLMLLLITGMEMDFARIGSAKRAALAASACGIIVPFALGVGLGALLPDSLVPLPGRRLITALFLGTALAISSVKIVASVVRDLNFLRRNVGQIIVATAIIDDTLGWIILSMLIGFAKHGELNAGSLAQTVLSTALFLLVSLTIGRRIVYFLIRWSNDHLVSEMPVITTTLVVMGTMALVTQAFGVQTVLGAFVAGMLIGQSPILTGHIEEQLRGMIVALFMPVFFGLAGLSADVRAIASPSLLLMTLAFIAVASLGKFAGAFAGGALGGLTRAESLALACGMNARGSTEVIVATIGLTVGALNTTLFTMIVAMAVVTTLLMPPMLRWAFARIPVSAQERTELERAQFEERGFVARLERVLLATDDSPSGRLASYLVGLLSAPRRMPVTALAPESVRDTSTGRHEQLVREAMEQAVGQSQAQTPQRDAPAGIDLIARPTPQSPAAAVAAEARKGYDLLVVGMEPLLAGQSALNDTIVRVTDGFERAVCIVNARGPDTEDKVRAMRRILLPVIGTSYSRAAADLSLALAQASGARVTALYVANERAALPWQGRIRRSWSLADAADTILQDVLNLAHHYAIHVRTAIARGAPDTAILQELQAGSYDLMVISVGTHPSESVFLASLPQALLARAPCSLALLSS